MRRPRPPGKGEVSLFLYVLIILAAFALDQLTKYLATVYLAPAGTLPFLPGVMELRFHLNDGAAFSSFSGARVFLIVFTGCALAALSRAGGGDLFQEFSAGLLLGLGVGCMAVGAVTLALSLKDEL